MSPSVPVRECGEPLVDVRTTSPLWVGAPPGTSIRLRSGLVDRLVLAQSLLPRPVRLLIVVGHVGSHATHCTGGAVDLTLFVCPAEPPAPGDPASALPPGSQRRLSIALTAAGLVNRPDRWWHWSHGDPDWAAITGTGSARYGPITGQDTLKSGIFE